MYKPCIRLCDVLSTYMWVYMQGARCRTSQKVAVNTAFRLWSQKPEAREFLVSAGNISPFFIIKYYLCAYMYIYTCTSIFGTGDSGLSSIRLRAVARPDDLGHMNKTKPKSCSRSSQALSSETMLNSRDKGDMIPSAGAVTSRCWLTVDWHAGRAFSDLTRAWVARAARVDAGVTWLHVAQIQRVRAVQAGTKLWCPYMHQTTQTWTDGTNTHILHTLYMHVLYTYCIYMYIYVARSWGTYWCSTCTSKRRPMGCAARVMNTVLWWGTLKQTKCTLWSRYFNYTRH